MTLLPGRDQLLQTQAIPAPARVSPRRLTSRDVIIALYEEGDEMAGRSTCLIGLHVLHALLRGAYPDSAITLERLQTLVPQTRAASYAAKHRRRVAVQGGLAAAIKRDDV
jgi:hypothetical protein